MLGFSSGLPLSLITSTLQAWFAESGMSLLATGALSLVGLPYTCKVLWGPLVDRFTLLASLGRRRSWILCMQILLFTGFNILACLTPQASAEYMAVIALILAVFSATQDIAIDAQRAEYLPVQQHGLGAFLGVFGYRMAMFVSGGLSLVVVHYLGWAWTYHAISLFFLLGAVAILCSQEPKATVLKSNGIVQTFTKPLQTLLAKERIGYLFLFILLYKTGEAFTATTSGIVMPFLIQGVGFSIDTIGYVNKILGISSLLFGGLCAGFILMYCSLYYSLLIFGLLQALTNLLFVALAMYGKNLALLSVAVVCDNLVAGMAATALVAFFMRLVDMQFTGTQFSLLVAISTVPRLFSGPVAASIQMYTGWVGLYQLSVLFALLFLPFLWLIRKHTEIAPSKKPALSRANEIINIQEAGN